MQITHVFGYKSKQKVCEEVGGGRGEGMIHGLVGGRREKRAGSRKGCFDRHWDGCQHSEERRTRMLKRWGYEEMRRYLDQ